MHNNLSLYDIAPEKEKKFSRYKFVKSNNNSFFSFFQALGSIASILSLLLTFTSVSSVITIFYGFYSIFNGIPGTPFWVTLLILSNICLVSLIVIFVTVKFFYKKRNLYRPEVLQALHHANHLCRDFVVNESFHNEEDFHVFLSDFSSVVSHAFSLATGKKCGVSIKKIVAEKKNRKTRIARKTRIKGICMQILSKLFWRESKESKHKLEYNCRYEFLFKHKRNLF